MKPKQVREDEHRTWLVLVVPSEELEKTKIFPHYVPQEKIVGRILGVSEADALMRLKRAIKRFVYPENAQLSSHSLEAEND